jgi:hypothetical protein
MTFGRVEYFLVLDCHDPRDRDNHFSLSQVYSNFFNYMRRTFSLSPLYYIIILCFSVAMVM